ncbi:unnamed protein product [Polarella glacialis]|uniref:U-box domain-containing protein n=2 Tax=Polarella glacialis TaxID=89957 RepID=A0A813M0C8_POLGL|nr:unnamed protein product [Polarella glacialis]
MASEDPSDCQQLRFAKYGQRWGEGVARYFTFVHQSLDEGCVRLLLVPDGFICPISQHALVDPVATVDACVYDREYIEQWIRKRQQKNKPILSPATGMELPCKVLMPLVALQRGVEAYLAHRPEFKASIMRARSSESSEEVVRLEQVLGEAATAKAQAEESRDKAVLEVAALKQRAQNQKAVLGEFKEAARRLCKQLQTQKAALATSETDAKQELLAAGAKYDELQDALAQVRADFEQRCEASEGACNKLQAEVSQVEFRCLDLQDAFTQAKSDGEQRLRASEAKNADLQNVIRRREEQLRQSRRWSATLRQELDAEDQLVCGWKEFASGSSQADGKTIAPIVNEPVIRVDTSSPGPLRAVERTRGLPAMSVVSGLDPPVPHARLPQPDGCFAAGSASQWLWQNALTSSRSSSKRVGPY